MPQEIERKFLVSGEGWRTVSTARIAIRQGYLFSTDQMSFRVRIVDDREAVITFKSGGDAISRGEYEYPVPLEDARELMDIAGARRLEKVRHTVPFAGKKWTIDEFGGRHAGLLLAELELEREDEPFERPGWLGEEVTADPAYRNAELSKPPA